MLLQLLLTTGRRYPRDHGSASLSKQDGLWPYLPVDGSRGVLK